MTETMMAAVLEEYGSPLVVKRVAKPSAGPGQLLIRLEASGVCHSDVHIWEGGYTPATLPEPFILGHEGVGVVEAVGAGVTGWRVGDRAGAAWLHDTCGTCAQCRAGLPNFCQAQRAHGLDVPGTFAEYVVTNANFTARVPTGEATGLAPLMCAGLTAFGALDRAALAPGECCAVFGCGGLGQYAIQFAKRRGARVIAVDRDPAKRALSQENGAAVAVDGGDTDEIEKLRASADVCVNFAPTTATWQPMLDVVRPLGRVVAAAMVSEPVPLNQEWLTGAGITITGTSVGTMAQMEALMQVQAADPLTSSVTEIPLSEVSRALRELAEGRAPARYAIRF
ncbi:alcohol dehydrogenase catalytic domain-containing protein [Pseudodonghicola flavimaris]|uniref:alcohol dehydrogenase n=1 Tax=Pseudodonghicola flavimaris TaxID=3050036 RepID=A0ABT7F8B5_9RHOB|nr:alcohol dehydrogenase catalytic domain-containing protein [Pseudodonghicola flavimaris]MDK3020841.1 alcohol dehydrogenase catalytic domain-containing protein [Pseudodonghicola flavimaris]